MKSLLELGAVVQVVSVILEFWLGKHTCVGFALVGTVLKPKLLPRIPVPLKLGSQGVHNVLLPLNSLLSSLDVLDDAIRVVQLAVALPELLAVLLDVGFCLAFHLLGNVCYRMPSILQQ